MKRIAIAVIAALFPICSAYADNGIYYHRIVDCTFILSTIKCLETLNSIPEGSTMELWFNDIDKVRTPRTEFIARHCKLDTVTILHDDEFRDVARYTLVCEKVKPREEKITTL